MLPLRSVAAQEHDSGWVVPFDGAVSKEDPEILILYCVEQLSFAEIRVRRGLQDAAACRRGARMAKKEARKAPAGEKGRKTDFFLRSVTKRRAQGTLYTEGSEKR